MTALQSFRTPGPRRWTAHRHIPKSRVFSDAAVRISDLADEGLLTGMSPYKNKYFCIQGGLVLLSAGSGNGGSSFLLNVNAYEPSDTVPHSVRY